MTVAEQLRFLAERAEDKKEFYWGDATMKFGSRNLIAKKQNGDWVYSELQLNSIKYRDVELKPQEVPMERIKLIERLYNKQSLTTDLKYEIINIAQESVKELLYIVSRTESHMIRFDIADLINYTNNDNVYVIELFNVNGALFVSTDYNETLEEWFKLTYLKEEQA